MGEAAPKRWVFGVPSTFPKYNQTTCPNRGTLPQSPHHLSTQFFINLGHTP